MSQELREELELLSGWDIPKCDVLEFLLEKMPVRAHRRPGYTSNEGDYWEASYWKSHIYVWSDDPVDAMLKLAINLQNKEDK